MFKNFKPNSCFDVVHYEYCFKANINSYGGRVSGQQNSNTSKIIIPFMGDSFTFGVGVGDEKAYVSLLNRKTYHFLLNLGVPGSNLENQQNIIKMRHEELEKPKVYIFSIFLGNDIIFKKIY